MPDDINESLDLRGERLSSDSQLQNFGITLVNRIVGYDERALPPAKRLVVRFSY